MKRFSLGLAVCVSLALPHPAAAQQIVNLFDAIPIAEGPFFPNEALGGRGDAEEFGSPRQLYLQCQAGDFASVIGPYAGNGLIVDDFIRVQGPGNEAKNYCMPSSCFGKATDPQLHIGEPAENAYTPVPPVDVSASLVPCLGLYTFSLTDWAFTNTASSLSLMTSCAVKDKVCHYDNGKNGHKTLTVGAAAISAHVGNHAGDYLGTCIDGK